MLGLARLDPDRRDAEARLVLESLVEQLAAAYRANASETWRWFEDALTYDNARLPHALVIGGAALGRDGDVAIGLESLRWLGDECGSTAARSVCPVISGDSARPAPGGGDEQPLDASAFVEAELAAFVVTAEPDHGTGLRSRSTGSSAATDSTGPCTTSPPAGAATASGRAT